MDFGWNFKANFVLSISIAVSLKSCVCSSANECQSHEVVIAFNVSMSKKRYVDNLRMKCYLLRRRRHSCEIQPLYNVFTVVIATILICSIYCKVMHVRRCIRNFFFCCCYWYLWILICDFMRCFKLITLFYAGHFFFLNISDIFERSC